MATRRPPTTRSAPQVHPGSGPDARYNCIATRYKSHHTLISYFGGRFLINVLSAPMTTSIAVSNGRLRGPALLVSTCSAHDRCGRCPMSAAGS